VKTIQDYLRHAAECADLARTARTQDEREMILQMADTWRMLAVQRKKLLLARESAVDLTPALAAVKE
jgi:hypothetical protein